MVAIITSMPIKNNLPHQFFSDKLLKKSWSFRAFAHIKGLFSFKVIAHRILSPPPPTSLDRAKISGNFLQPFSCFWRIFSDAILNPSAEDSNKSSRLINLGCVFLGESKNRFVISDHLDHGASKEQMNPLWTRIRRFLWCTMIRMMWDHKSIFGFSQKNAPLTS